MKQRPELNTVSHTAHDMHISSIATDDVGNKFPLWLREHASTYEELANQINFYWHRLGWTYITALSQRALPNYLVQGPSPAKKVPPTN